MQQRTDWFLDIQETAAPNRIPKNVLALNKVAPGSPAAELELSPGDIFVSVNGQAALTAEVSDILIANDTVTYVFIRHADSKQITVNTPALPMGIRTEAAPDDIVTSYKDKPLHDLDGILTLWEREDYVRIRQICKNATSKGMLGKLGLSKTRNLLADVLTAMCDVEAGKGQAAYKVITDFNKEHGDRIRSDLAGLLGYYIARQHREAGNVDRYHEAMHRVMEFKGNQESPRMLADADANGLTYITRNARLGQRFSGQGDKEYLAGGTGVGQMSEIVKTMQPGQIMPVCLMLTYRGNGPYDAALKVYRSIYPFLKDTMRPLVVLTSIRDRPSDHPEYFVAEDALIAADIPITVLYDEHALWADLVVAGAPEYLLLNEQTKIFWDDTLHDDYAYWEMLAASKDEVP